MLATLKGREKYCSTDRGVPRLLNKGCGNYLFSPKEGTSLLLNGF